ncbi:MULTISPECIES: GNAT family N-acetyltransferase [Flavobacterium]|uniref:GNAT family N-acetyltransferase n=1 Tax=Flavobacterium jumunjinense TaxID=998845 RepID=A0ABV5GR98_9FLAO|nr:MULTISPECIES: GNAT family N-acetyltransferase [Flavobacterium]
MIEVKEIATITEMLEQIEIIQQMYPDYTLEKYEALLNEMLPLQYKQVLVLENEVCIGLAGFWIATKLWSGKYLELDNVIVHTEHRSKGIGELIAEYLNKKAIEANCNVVVLDAYTSNYRAQKFFFNQGFVPQGFHFVKHLKK